MNELDYSIVGMRFGRLTVTRFSHMSSAGNPYWECECDCGDRIVAAEDRLLRGKVKSCGCQPRGRTRTDLTGRRFGRLVVLGFDHSTVRNDLYWLCRCDCGNEKVIKGSNLRHGLTTSCGCRKLERRSEDLTGKRFGRLYVANFDHMAGKGVSYWKCECDCGNTTVVARSALLRGAVVSCGCKSKEGLPVANLTGMRFGMLSVVEFDHKDRRSGSYWLCRCDCGNEALFRTRELLDGTITSCGCKNGNPNYFGNKSYDSLYVIWRNMKKRCENINDRAYKNYGGRGIYLCDEWQYFKNFRSWALTNGYDNGLTIDRIDNDDGYYPENCRWVDDIVQANNRRSNHYVSYAGSTHSIAEWSRILDVDYQRLLRSINKGDMIYFEKYYDNYNEE